MLTFGMLLSFAGISFLKDLVSNRIGTDVFDAIARTVGFLAGGMFLIIVGSLLFYRWSSRKPAHSWTVWKRSADASTNDDQDNAPRVQVEAASERE